MNRILHSFSTALEKLHRDEPSPIPVWIQGVLRVISAGYGKAAELRRQQRKGRCLSCPVISVGNITLGGTGKSPMTVYIARVLQDMGFHPAILSRGYRGFAENTGAVVSNGRQILADAAISGDEPLMMALLLPGIPVLAGKNRFQSGIRAVESLGCDLVILDDGFQHLDLARNIDLVLLDCRRPFGNGRLFPEGPLREPLSALQAADAILLTRCPADPFFPEPVPGVPAGIPVFSSRHHTVLRDIWPAGLSRKRQQSRFVHFRRSETRTDFPRDINGILAFSGIAGNTGFREALRNMGGRITGYLEFPDHHPYSLRDAGRIIAAARSCQADMLVTTEKDACRLAGLVEWPHPVGIAGADIVLPFAEKQAFSDFLRRRLEPGKCTRVSSPGEPV